MAFFEHDSHLLHYEACGAEDGGQYTPILLLHGNGEDMTIFGETVAPLLASNRFYLLDSRLHGESRPLADASRTLHYSDMANDALALMDGLGVREYDVVGYSDGGIIALIMAMRSMNVRKVITLGANTDPKGLTFFARRALSREYKRCLQRGDALGAELQRLMLEEPHITANELARIVAEVTVVIGSRDHLIDRKHSERIADAIPHGSHRVLEGAGHGIPETHPEALADIIRTVL